MKKTRASLEGKLFGRLTVKEFVGIGPGQHALWLCQCVCGELVTCPTMRLTSGNTKSCGCLHADIMREKATLRPKTIPTCGHPERKNYAFGLCKECWRHLPENAEKSAKTSANYRERQKKELGPEGYKQFLWERNLRSNYTLTPEIYDGMLEKQPACPCGASFSNNTPRVDHNHKCCPGRNSCGKCIRGFLCNRCNLVLGLLEENPDLLPQYLLKYLRQYA